MNQALSNIERPLFQAERRGEIFTEMKVTTADLRAVVDLARQAEGSSEIERLKNLVSELRQKLDATQSPAR